MPKRADTVEYDPRPVLERMSRQEAPTLQMDAEAVRKAAEESASAMDPRAPIPPRATPAVVRREERTLPFRTVHQPREPFAEIAVVGVGDVHALPLRQVALSGLTVAAGEEQAPHLRPGARAVVHIALDLAGEHVELRLTARVEHRRRGRGVVEGGIRLAWTGDDAPVAAGIRRLVRLWNARNPVS